MFGGHASIKQICSIVGQREEGRQLWVWNSKGAN